MGMIDDRQGEENRILGSNRLGPLEEGCHEKGKYTQVGVQLGPQNATFAGL